MRIPVNNCELHCEVAGDGPPILFVHGFPLTGEMWRPTVERLGAGWRSIVPDLRGHGRSGVSEKVTIKQFADDLAAMLDGLGERRPAVVVGLSMGGVIAFELYRRHRARIRALVLSDTRANAETEEGAARREIVAQTALREGSRAAADLLVKGLLAAEAPAELREHWHAVIARTAPAGIAAAARALAQRPESISTLPRIDCPTLVVCGAADELTPPELMREMCAKIPGGRFELIAEAGHMPPVEQPDAFACVLRAFLAALP